MSASSGTDVVIVGAGLAGASAAAVLGRKGVRVVLVDARVTYPACFKAEKIEADQAELLRKFGLMEGLRPFASRIKHVLSARHGRILRDLCLEQYGIFYQDMVNGVRAQIPSSVTQKIARIQTIATGSDVSRVTFMGGETLTARLVVLACGTGGNLHAGLGLRKHMIRAGHSFSIGFNMAREDGQPFPFDALTYYPDGVRTQIAYLTLFPIREVMRANLFVYRSPGEEWVTQFRHEPHVELVRALPELVRLTEPFHITSRIEMCPIDLYRVGEHLRPGLVLIGDAYQSVCPTTGTGLSKVLTDVDALCDFVPEWLETPGMGVEKTARYYDHPRKKAWGEESLQRAMFCRTLSMDSSLRWRIQRELRYLGMRMQGMAKQFTTSTGLGPEEHSTC
jgi:2-polyprenyl-6-methoxyphenol hydroxylase-like FAD-dependent oxidoreductase